MSSIETKTSVVIQKADHFSVRVRPGLMMFSPARYGYLIGILFLLAISTQICMGAESNETIAAAGMVTVTNVVVDPSVLMTGDVGLVTFTVQNTGTSNVVITDAHLISNDVTVLNSEIYLTSRTIGAGTSMEFPFTILVNSPSQIFVLNPAQNHNHDINDNVITLMIRYGGNIFLLIGDAGKKVEYGFCQNRRIRNRCTEDRPPWKVENDRYAIYQSCLIE